MGTLARVASVEYLGGRVLRVTFTDDLVRELDFAGVLVGVLSTLDSAEKFGAATVDSTSNTVSWPGGIDLDPDVLHGRFEALSGVQPRLLREYRLHRAS
jgi:hypothetical protein